MFGYCRTQVECTAICDAVGLPAGQCSVIPSEGAMCCFCEI